MFLTYDFCISNNILSSTVFIIIISDYYSWSDHLHRLYEPLYLESKQCVWQRCFMLLLLYVVVVYLISFCKIRCVMRPKRPLASGFAVVVKVPSFYVCRKIKANSKIMLTHTHTFDVVAWFSTFFNGFSKECFLIRKYFCVYHYLMRTLVTARHLANLARKYLFEKSY